MIIFGFSYLNLDRIICARNTQIYGFPSAWQIFGLVLSMRDRPVQRPRTDRLRRDKERGLKGERSDDEYNNLYAESKIPKNRLLCYGHFYPICNKYKFATYQLSYETYKNTKIEPFVLHICMLVAHTHTNTDWMERIWNEFVRSLAFCIVWVVSVPMKIQIICTRSLCISRVLCPAGRRSARWYREWMWPYTFDPVP